MKTTDETRRLEKLNEDEKIVLHEISFDDLSEDEQKQYLDSKLTPKDRLISYEL